MSVRLVDRSFQYPIGIVENMLVKVGKFTFPVDFVILKMEDDRKVPLILGRPFLYTVDVVIRVKQKQLNLGVGSESMVFLINSAMKHSYSNDDICFSIDVIDEILEEDFDAPLDEGRKILYSIEGTPLEDKIFAKFDKISLEERPTDLELKPLLDHLEYAFLEEPSFLPVIISSQLSKQNKDKLIVVLKRHKQAFALKTTHNLDANLVLNWEKCHFIVKEGIVLGQKVSEAGHEVDKAKIEVKENKEKVENDALMDSSLAAILSYSSGSLILQSSASTDSCRYDAFRKHDHDKHQGDDAPPGGRRNVDKQVPTIYDHERMEATIRDMLINQFRDVKEYAYHLEQAKKFMENQVIHATLFREEDLKERMIRWVRRVIKTFNEEARLSIQNWKDSWHKRMYKIKHEKVRNDPEEVFYDYKIVKVVRVTTKQQDGLDFMQQIIVMRENDKRDIFSEADFKYQQE
ncbi:reverse transcriptase domain-containing protein [Tanacetum coccineum]